MRKTILCVVWIVAASMMLAASAYAYSHANNGGNGGLGSGMGTEASGTKSGISAKSYDAGMQAGSLHNLSEKGHEVSIYGTDTGTQFLNGNANGSHSGTINRPGTYHDQSFEDGGYRATAVTSSDNNKAWGWLGLLGLLGLFGMRNRNPQRNDR
ncbi:WGxxGxxG family protein [Paenibacillus sp. HB172176]|uniref:WGxxGxxG family protein n=1 Tax=Paenibacillus sp. HB172176 TaxID=2493690 RepID=UPI001F0FE7F0|nr:WGxxGxxG family protein [Paenibacillus sp. HB172176]